MEYNVDTLIVGGGPAGTSCALTLQKLGVSCAVAEKRAYPRKKTCGGMVTEKAYLAYADVLGELGEDFERAFSGECGAIELYRGTKLLVRTDVSKKFRYVKREIFDAYLAEKFRAAGGTVFENSEIRRIDFKSRTAYLPNGDSVSYRYLVAADGAKSLIRKQLGLKDPVLGFCVETHVPSSSIPEADAPRIYFDVLKNGYAWVFPTGVDLCIGFGNVYDKNVPYTELFKSFLKKLGIDPGGVKLEGAFEPCGSLVNQRRGDGRVILIGDAGGFVQPLFGEGLYYAAVTGRLAAEAIASGGGAKARFIESVSDIAKTVKKDGMLQKLFFSPVFISTFFEKIKGRKAFTSYFCDRCLSEDISDRGLLELVKEYKSKK